MVRLADISRGRKMKRISFLISLLGILVLTTGMTIKETNQATDISLYTNPSGTVTKQAAVDGTTGRWKVNAITNLNGTGAPNFPFGATGITAAVSDFNLNAISHPTLTLGGGYMLLPDGRELATWDGAANNAGNYGGNLSINLTTVAAASGTTVSATTAYYLYIDTTGLTSATTGDTGRKLYRVQQANLALFTTVPDAINGTRYIYLGSLQTNGSSQFTVIASAATKKSALPVPNVSPIVYTLAKQAIGSVGSAGQVFAGHALQTTEWPFTISGKLAYYNLSASATTDNSGALSCTSAACTLSNSVSPVTITSTNIFGSSNAAATFNGTSQSLSSTNTFFNPGNGKSFSFGGWFAATDWTPTISATVMNMQNGGSDRAANMLIGTDGSVQFNGTNSAASIDSSLSVPNPGFVDGSWHHIVWSYNFASGQLRGYIDGRLVGQVALANVRAMTTPIFQIGGINSPASNFFGGKAQDIFFVNNVALTDADIRKIYALRIDHNQNVASDRQLWTATWTRADTFQQNTLDNSWIVDEQPNSVYADFSDQASTDLVALRLQDIGISATAVPVRTFDSGYMTTGGTYTATHGLSEIPTAVVVQYESSTGNFENLNPESYCTVSTTTINCDFGGLTVGASNRLRVIASVAPAAIAVAAASATQAGIVSLGNQQMGTGDKYFAGKVGVGTTAPNFLVELASADASTNPGSVPVTAPTLRIQNTDPTVGNLEQIVFANSAASTQTVASIAGVNESHATSGTGHLEFGTKNAGAYSIKMTLDKSGNLGVGTTAPTSLAVGVSTRILEVQDAAGGLLALRRAGNEEFSLYPGSNGFFIDASGQATASNNDIVFRSASANASNTVTEWMRIKGSTGIVQIGTDGTLAANRYAQFPVNGASNGPTIRWDDNATTVSALTLQNLQSGGAWANNLRMQFQTTGVNGGTAGDGVILQALQQQNWTSTGTTQDADFVIKTSLDGSVAEKWRVTAKGVLQGVITSVSPIRSVPAVSQNTVLATGANSVTLSTLGSATQGGSIMITCYSSVNGANETVASAMCSRAGSTPVCSCGTTLTQNSTGSFTGSDGFTMNGSCQPIFTFSVSAGLSGVTTTTVCDQLNFTPGQ